MKPRLCAGAFALAIGCASAVHAQAGGDPPPVIEWSADRPLTIRDFKGKAPARATAASLSSVAIEASWECDGGRGTWRARAVFDPAWSWWREINQNIWQSGDAPSLMAPKDDGGRGLLAHEQVHFDLTEIWAGRIRAALASLESACRTPGGSRTIEQSVADLQRGWQDEQKKYDQDTDHGLDAARQRDWTAKAARTLKAATPRPAPLRPTAVPR
jgi:Bacterial protein of unknown function (DUF922)